MTTTDKRGTLMLCRFCWEERLGEDAAGLQERARVRGVDLQWTECLAACDDGPSAAIVAPGAWTYLLGRLSVDDGAALIWGADALAKSADGVLPWENRPARFRQVIRGRIPPLPAAT